VVGFQMPGIGMPDYTRNSVTIAKAGIYDLRLHHDAVVQPVLKFWNVFERTDLGPDGEQAREELAEFMTGLDAQASRFVEQRDKMLARQAAKSGKANTITPE
jgi:acyl-[acyl-carrier-protein] desaturase